MVVVEEVTKLSERRTQTSSEAFPGDALASIQSAVEAVPASVFDGSTKHTEVGELDAASSYQECVSPARYNIVAKKPDYNGFYCGFCAGSL